MAGDVAYAVGFADTGGARLVAAAGGVVDEAGSAAQREGGCREGAGLDFPTSDGDTSFARLDGDRRDTHDNAADFALGPSDPENAMSTRPAVSVADVMVVEAIRSTSRTRRSASS